MNDFRNVGMEYSQDTDIHIFKTSVMTAQERDAIASILDCEQDIKTWTIDLEDWEKVLRVVVKRGVTADAIIGLLLASNIHCKELND